MIRSTLFTTVFCLLTPLAQAQMAPGTGMEMDDEAYEAVNELQTTGQKANLPVEASLYAYTPHSFALRITCVFFQSTSMLSRKYSK